MRGRGDVRGGVKMKRKEGVGREGAGGRVGWRAAFCACTLTYVSIMPLFNFFAYNPLSSFSTSTFIPLSSPFHLTPFSLSPSSQGVIVVFDVTDTSSFQKAKNWVKELKRMLPTHFSLTIVGNKIDMEKNRTVHAQEAKE